jgi:predicted phosphate transport protein (TIGR00153 family)
MFNLLPKDTVFFDLFEGLARHAISSAEHLRQLAKLFPAIDNEIQRIRQEEHQADDLTHKALERLDQTFITPFDREDIHELVNGIDDIIDMIDALAKRFPIFHVMTMTQDFRQQTDVLVQATIAMSDAVHRLRKTRKLSELKDTLIEIHRLESVGDDVNHAALSKLYDGQTAALEVMKWKELYDYIENAIDGCEDVGNTLERIVLKNG